MSDSPQPSIPLDAKYLVGVDALDAQHQQIASVLNDLRELLVTKKPAQLHVEFLTRLLHTIKTHFATEEQYLRVHACPRYLRHRAAHEGLANNLAELREQIATRRRELTLEYVDLMTFWMLDHFAEFDREYADFLARAKAPTEKEPQDDAAPQPSAPPADPPAGDGLSR